MQKKTGAMLGAMMIVATCQAQAGTAEQSEWNEARVQTAALPCAGASRAAMAMPVKDTAGFKQSSHVYDTLERLVESGQIMNLRHTMTGADLWLAEPAGKRCAAGVSSRRGKCAS